MKKTYQNSEKKIPEDSEPKTTELERKLLVENQVYQTLIELGDDKKFRYQVVILLERIAMALESQATTLREDMENSSEEEDSEEE